jgi:hypothetical protein
MPYSFNGIIVFVYAYVHMSACFSFKITGLIFMKFGIESLL